MAFIIFRLALYVALFINNYGTALESDFTDFTSDSSAPYTTAASTVPYRSCEDYCANGDTSTGVKQIFINGNLVNVFCYGCWTAIQSRAFGGADFNVTFEQYRKVIGRATSPPSDFYLGNDNLYALTADYVMKLWVQLTDCDGGITNSFYDTFRIGSLSENFRLYATNYATGDGGDALNYDVFGNSDNGQPFATAATYNPNGGLSPQNCPALLYGGWWFGSCRTNLNGKWYRVTPPYCEATVPDGIRWMRSGNYSLSGSLMFLCSSCPQPF